MGKIHVLVLASLLFRASSADTLYQLTTNGPTSFLGANTGIGSWFRADNTQDFTNGRSWCSFPYKDYSMGFAPDLQTITAGSNAVYPNPLWSKYGSQYCGLEAWVYNPANGRNVTMYIIDGFAHEWVKTPGSIDLMLGAYVALAGKLPDSKNDVLSGVQWGFTGQRSQKYSFGGAGDPTDSRAATGGSCSASTDCQSLCCTSSGQCTSAGSSCVASASAIKLVDAASPQSAAISTSSSNTLPPLNVRRSTWAYCSKSSQCANSCCSKEFSNDGKYKSTSLRTFLGTNYGIGSWFRANNTQDSTNGHSWCSFIYKDYSMGFAPDLQAMTAGTNAVYPNSLWSKYGGQYCGLEAWVYNPTNGRNVTMYIIDAFDHEWVKTPGSIDLMLGAYVSLAGSVPTAKSVVLSDVKWGFTGRRSQKYSFGGAGDTTDSRAAIGGSCSGSTDCQSLCCTSAGKCSSAGTGCVESISGSKSVAPSSGPSAVSLKSPSSTPTPQNGGLGDWVFCSKSSQCANNCCSKEYSNDGKYKCTPGGSKCL
ncbi:hypothetical protein SmJEL517_g00359 [Synchytrium microbalum]|uniref:Uncharacterized protein n=1 Tax=Synchytrium microbalum TaxID=1806994 RepID=A0A507CIW8_9FUNG|nr:uncharacterized protein SmJEL517_g00359 [Synchytrium microbalum]TPX38114.1 hypothetical protein SmJEL517_g00359 [Synchytrium microbalum]